MAVAVTFAVATSFGRRNELDSMVGRVIEAELGLRGERKCDETSSHNPIGEKDL